MLHFQDSFLSKTLTERRHRPSLVNNRKFWDLTNESQAKYDYELIKNVVFLQLTADLRSPTVSGMDKGAPS